MYRSPSGDPLLSADNLAHLLSLASAQNPTHLLIVGDFNVPQIDWKNNFCGAPGTHYAHKFLATFQDALLFQHVLEPTRYREAMLLACLI